METFVGTHLSTLASPSSHFLALSVLNTPTTPSHHCHFSLISLQHHSFTNPCHEQTSINITAPQSLSPNIIPGFRGAFGSLFRLHLPLQSLQISSLVVRAPFPLRHPRFQSVCARVMASSDDDVPLSRMKSKANGVNGGKIASTTHEHASTAPTKISTRLMSVDRQICPRTV